MTCFVVSSDLLTGGPGNEWVYQLDGTDINIITMKIRASSLTLYLGEDWVKEDTEWYDDDGFPDCKEHHCLQIKEYVITYLN